MTNEQLSGHNSSKLSITFLQILKSKRNRDCQFRSIDAKKYKFLIFAIDALVEGSNLE